ncbi:MAG TPA: lysylphosphatidylglycerol synthase transmembrane domain-containing protein [Longimicrobiaceae bacterium]|jgi:uncharacterized protein (TIRG00374 family)|nr:lysylphosphatidylglycerol synthase transmembrane domain-containing protein [Longimicrobiaceae bacterium]
MKPDLKTVVGLAITVASLWWAFRGVSMDQVWTNVTHANLALLALAAFLSTLGLAFRALRWKSLLPPETKSTFAARNAAVSVGFGLNNALPARLGEFARVATLNRLSGIPIGTVLGSLVLERVFDGFIIVAMLFAAMASPSFPAHLGTTDPRTLALPVAAFAGGLGIVLFLLAIFPVASVRTGERLANFLPEAFRRPIVDSLHTFVGSLGVLRSPARLVGALAWAAAQWLFLSLSYLAALNAFGITTPGFVGAVFLQAVVAIAVAVPSSPGFFGVSEAASRIALAPWQIDDSRIVSYAIGFHIAGWLPVTALGFWYIWRLGLNLSEMKNSETVVEEAVEAADHAAAAERAKRA